MSFTMQSLRRDNSFPLDKFHKNFSTGSIIKGRSYSLDLANSSKTSLIDFSSILPVRFIEAAWLLKEIPEDLADRNYVLYSCLIFI